MKTAEEILAEAADLIEKGWCQGHRTQRNEGGRVIALCVGGALMVADGASPYDLSVHSLSAAALAAIRAIEREVGGAIPIYNDARGRTVEEVAAACRNSKRHL